MGKVLITDSILNEIATAIREKNGKSTLYKPREMAAAVRAIPTGGGGAPTVLSGTSSPSDGLGNAGDIYVLYTFDTFTRLNYIENSGGNKFHNINLDYYIKSNTRIIVDCYVYDTVFGSWQALFGARELTPWYVFYTRKGSSNAFGCEINHSTLGNVTSIYNKRITVTCDISHAEWTDGERVFSQSFSFSCPATSPLTLFASGFSGAASNEAGKYRIYSLKIYEGTDLVMDLNPISYNAGQVGSSTGLYDSVSCRQFYSANNVDFTEGDALSTFQRPRILATYIKLGGENPTWIITDKIEVTLEEG